MKTKKLGISLLLFCIHVQPLTNPSGFKLWTQERPPTTTTFSKTSLSSCWASSLKTDLLLHLLLRWYSQPEVGVILVRNKSDHDTFLPRVLEGSRSVKVKIKVITVSFVTPHNLASCDIRTVSWLSSSITLLSFTAVALEHFELLCLEAWLRLFKKVSLSFPIWSSFFCSNS